MLGTTELSDTLSTQSSQKCPSCFLPHLAWLNFCSAFKSAVASSSLEGLLGLQVEWQHLTPCPSMDPAYPPPYLSLWVETLFPHCLFSAQGLTQSRSLVNGDRRVNVKGDTCSLVSWAWQSGRGREHMSLHLWLRAKVDMGAPVGTGDHR